MSGTPLQEVYEKLTNVSLYSAYKPVVACNLCYWQLRKCHKLMTRLLRADELLTRVLQTGSCMKQDLISIIDQETCQLDDGLTISTIELNNFGSEYSFEEKIKDEPSDIEKEAEHMPYVDNIKVESSDDASGPENVINIKTEEIIHEEYVVYDEEEDVGDITDGIDEIDGKKLEGNSADAGPSMTYDIQHPKFTEQHSITTTTLLYNNSTTRDEEKSSTINNTNENLPKKYICDTCDHTFGRKHLLIQHIECLFETV